MDVAKVNIIKTLWYVWENDVIACAVIAVPFQNGKSLIPLPPLRGYCFLRLLFVFLFVSRIFR